MDKKIFLIFALLLLVVSVSFAVAHTNGTDDLTQSDSDVKVSNTDDVLSNLPVSIVVNWDDSADDSKRPSSVKVNIIVAGNECPIDISAADDWKYSGFDVIETTDVVVTPYDVPGYTVKVTGDLETGFTITYTLIKETPSDDNSTDDTQKVDNSTDDSSKDDSTPDQPDKAPSKKTVKTKKYVVKDKHNTGYPVLAGLLAISAAGLAVQLRRRD